ncbi:MAG: C-GCAxxG-C-C family protein [Desulfobulbaceae bacterium]|nr:C-GCAxxG-C-C family protein [Desulfobulbaceae bacterium]HIJ78878.1 chain A iron centre cytochrome C protein [Deltaproteobacteria bacterium]
MESGQKKDSKGLSRREMMIGTGVLAATTAVAHFGGLVKKADASAPQWPWPYKKLDPAKTAELCYNEWYRVFCGCAVINSVFKQLAETVGEPYASFPSDSFVFLEGGQVGWGTICGSPAGANITANLIIGPRIAGSPVGHQISADIMQWYSEANMPVFVPQNPKIDPKAIPQTISDSPLCHISVGKWMKAAGKPLKSAERKDRCARVAASTAYRLVELLNDWADGKYTPTHDFTCSKEHGITGQYNCTECHGDNVPTPPQG